MGGAPSVSPPPPINTGQEYGQAIQAYTQNAPALYQEESQYQPLYNQMQQGIMGSNIGFYGNAIESQIPQAQDWATVGQWRSSLGQLENYKNQAAGSAMATLKASPQLQQIANYGQQQIGAGQDPVLQGILGQVQGQQQGMWNTMTGLQQNAATMYNPTNQQLQGLSNQVGAQTGAGVGALAGLAGQAATGGPIFQQTAGTIMGQLGNQDPLTAQLQQTAQQQLALGGTLSPQAQQDADQQARAAYSARGMLNSSGSIAAEVLNRDAVSQARLQQRQQYATGVDTLVQQQNAQRVQNALGLNAQQSTNQALAGQLYQGALSGAQAGAQVQGGLQQQIAANLGTSQQLQQSAAQQAIANQQANQQLAMGTQGAILDQQYRQQQAGLGALTQVYGAQQNTINQVMGAPQAGATLATAVGGMVPGYGSGSPNLFQGSGLLSLMNQNNMAYYNAQASANQMNAQSKGAASGAMLSAGASIAGAAIGAGALLL